MKEKIYIITSSSQDGDVLLGTVPAVSEKDAIFKVDPTDSTLNASLIDEIKPVNLKDSNPHLFS